MESRDPAQVVRDAFAEEGYQEVDMDFALSEVDQLTRRVGARALEEAFKVRIPDAAIESALTVGDLVRLTQDNA